MSLFECFVYDEDGQGMVEYALIIGIMAVLAAFLIVLVGAKVRDKYSDMNTKLDMTNA